MKDYSKIEKYESGNKHYYNENDLYHRLTGPAIEWSYGDKSYWINDTWYMKIYKNDNKLRIHQGILKLTLEYEKYIKQNIKDLIIELNTKIDLSYGFYTQKGKLNKNYVKQIPDWLKDLIIL